MSTSTPLMTAEDLIARVDDGMRSELVAGELRMMTPAGYEHGIVIHNLSLLLGNFVKAHHLGGMSGSETGFLLQRQPDTVRVPDLALVRRARVLESGVPKTFYPGPPDLAVEVMSPNDRMEDVDEKVRDYLVHGVLEVWVVNPSWRSVTVFHAEQDSRTFNADEVLESPELLPGFRCPVVETFNLPQ